MPAVSKEAMNNLTNMLNSSTDGHVPDQSKAPEADPSENLDPNSNLDPNESPSQDPSKNLDPDQDPDAVAIHGDAENGFTNDAGESVNDQGQPIDAEGNVIEAGEPATGDDGEPIYTPKELAEAIGWSQEDIYNGVMIPMDDGQDPISLGDIKNVHQNLVRDHATLQAQMTDMNGQLQQAQSGFNQGQQMTVEMQEAQSYLRQIDQMETNTNWKELEDLDPTDAVMKRQKIAKAREDTQKHLQQLFYKQEQQKQLFIQQAGVKMREVIPAWKDDTAMNADQSIIRSHMQSVGFHDNEINQIADPRVMVLLKELIDLRSLKAKGAEAVKRVRKAPTVLKGGRRLQKPSAKEQTNKLVNKAKQSGKKVDELNAVKSVISGYSKK